MNTPVFVQTQLAQPIHDVVGGLACNVGKHDITGRPHRHTTYHGKLADRRIAGQHLDDVSRRLRG